MESMPRKRRFRRLFQFRLRSMLVLLTLSALGLSAYYGYAVPYRQQHQAGLALAAKGASLEFSPMEPAWLAALLRIGVDEAVLQDCVAVHAEQRHIKDDDLIHLEHMPRLERLYLAGNPITDKGLVHLRGLEHLERLSLWGTSITDDGLQHVGQLPALRVLDIHKMETAFALGTHGSQDKLLSDRPPGVPYRRATGLTSKCLTNLTGTPNLRSIYFSFPMGDEGLAQLTTLPHLRLRTLVLQGVTDKGMSHLSQFRDLETLVIEDSALGPDALQSLRPLPRLQWLAFRDVQAASGGWEPLGDLVRLKQLSLIGTPIDDRGVESLVHLQGLRSLSLRTGSLNDHNVAHLARLTGLRTLDLRDTSVSADALEKLRNLKGLEELRFESPFDDEAVGCLLQMDRLTRLHGHEFYLSNAGVAQLAKLRCVTYVNLHDAEAGAGLRGIDLTADTETLSDAGLAPLWDSTTLQTVRVYGREITSACVPWDRRTNRFFVYLFGQRPLNEVFQQRLDRVNGVEIQSRWLKLKSLDGPGPNTLTVSYETDECPLEMLRYFPSIRRLMVRPHHKHPAQCNWDNLRFVTGIDAFEMSLGQPEEARINSVGLRRIGEMANLRTLICCLSDEITADDFAVLGNLKSLQNLEFECAELNPDFMRILGRLTDLRQLQVIQTSVNRDEPLGLEHLVNLQQLTSLRISGLTDADMPSLAKLRRLQTISLTDNEITDNEFGRLAGLPQLRRLNVGREVSRERLEVITILLPPQVRVER